MYPYNFDPDDEDNLAHIKQFSCRIWRWNEGSGDRFFAIPVFSLKDERDIKKHVIKPLKKLFEGGDESDSFPDDSPVYSTDLAF